MILCNELLKSKTIHFNFYPKFATPIIAGQIAEKELQSYMSKGPEVISRLFSESDHRFMTQNEVKYQLLVNAFYDDKKKKEVRVLITVDDLGFWSTLIPLCRDDFYYLND